MAQGPEADHGWPDFITGHACNRVNPEDSGSSESLMTTLFIFFSTYGLPQTVDSNGGLAGGVDYNKRGQMA